ncbi:hypothetical protein ASPZODRAFT_11633 [Penicilliopsis zonata CBS 506.65]|uniref:Uncharacterized protein n=1 Tax=Penicilliopsis zonata CBS 506.65 TaxID=1073090 RepID=A0A1L9SUA3_9EURO|nr:hypothetical protein ASPZODRAFT_11633 [Penicilliopsis zonata CBS 506.65]OJJ50782.1 hypothetical protein ASPZODRAFT_11633 [Penicilliopsis zonata CBS 506.65]
MGETLLHFAAMSGNAALCRYLLEMGANANAENDSGENPLHYAMWNPRHETHIDLARLFVQKGEVDPTQSYIFNGIIHSYQGSAETFRFLVH